MGRPSKFKRIYSEQAAQLCALGATDKQMAQFFDVSDSTLSLWKNEYPAFSEALNKAKEESDNQVVKSLFQRAIGYSHPDVHISNFQGQITVTPIEKHYAPSEVACIFWLKNRQREHWKDRYDTALQNPDGSALLDSAAVEIAKALLKSPQPIEFSRS